jgi:hypothetical protein
MKKYVWIFAISIVVFLLCTYYVGRRVESISETAVVTPRAEPRAPEDRMREVPLRPAPGVIPKPAPQPGAKAAGQNISIVAVMQALSGLIAAITGLLGVIKSFRRDRAAS